MKSRLAVLALAIAVLVTPRVTRAQCAPLTAMPQVYNTVVQTATDGEPQYGQLSIFNQGASTITVSIFVKRLHPSTTDVCGLATHTNPVTECVNANILIPPGTFVTELFDFQIFPGVDRHIQVTVYGATMLAPVVEMELLHFDNATEQALRVGHYQVQRAACQ